MAIEFKVIIGPVILPYYPIGCDIIITVRAHFLNVGSLFRFIIMKSMNVKTAN